MSNSRSTRRPSTAVARKARPEQISYQGKFYRLADKIGIWPLMQLARAAQEGVNSTDLRGLAALHAMFQDMLDPRDWPRFEADMIAAKMDDPMGLLQTTQDAVARVQARQAARAAANGHGTAPAPRAAAVPDDEPDDDEGDEFDPDSGYDDQDDDTGE